MRIYQDFHDEGFYGLEVLWVFDDFSLAFDAGVHVVDQKYVVKFRVLFVFQELGIEKS